MTWNEYMHKTKTSLVYPALDSPLTTWECAFLTALDRRLRRCSTTKPKTKDIPIFTKEQKLFVLYLKVNHIHTPLKSDVNLEIEITPVNWSRLEQNSYGTNRYSHLGFVWFGRCYMFITLFTFKYCTQFFDIFDCTLLKWCRITSN